MKKETKQAIGLIAIIAILLLPQCLGHHNEQKNAPEANFEALGESYEVIFESTEQLIERLAIENNFDVVVALRISECESQFGKYKTNWEGSSAYGLYQFTNRTWEHYCSGDKDSYIDQTNCFIKLHKIHPSWWSCR